ncbi:MAG: class I SAM-dependent methyltransferase [Myxococcales bacterium]|nr:class I SAM-dependent methyltransferase [Myxococcota bacterium]MDW8281001.1 class I SAM-dependent methyltransferase [Myxococcales bacterium]
MAEDQQAAAWREASNRFHEALVQERGEGWQAFWGSEESQRIRYDVFRRYLPIAGRSLLDVGCGFGDLHGYLEAQGIRPARYLGVDLDARIVEAARRRRPQAQFQVLDLLVEDPPFRPDLIVASGIMAVGFDGYEDYVLRILRRFHALCKEGFALNFLSTCTRSPDPRSRYVDPAWLLGLFQREVDWRCVLVHDYRPNDFTLVHRKQA